MASSAGQRDMSENEMNMEHSDEEKAVVSRNFIEQMIDKDLAEGVYDRVHTRFPPEPNGYLHIGHAKSILLNYGLAQQYHGQFNMRFDDTNPTKEKTEYVESIKEDIAWLGADWEDRLFFASDYFEQMYEGAVKLIEKGKAYYCFCDKERLASLTQTVAGKEINVYDKHCLHLSKEEVETNLAAGKPYVIRQNNPTEGTTTFHDDIYGDITVDNAELDDMILIKSDGYPTYNFANVVDDHLMGITHVVRGNEYLSSSPKYNRLYDAFGWEVPEYVHCPLITDENHQKLSKRCGHSSYEDLIEQGFLSEAIVNFVALLGWSPEDNEEIFSLDELVKRFDYHHLSKSPAVFDYTKLKWMNGEYLKAMDFDRFYEMAQPYLKEAVKKDYDLKKIAAMVKTRIEIFPDIKEHVDFFDTLPDYDTAMYTHKKMKTNAETSLAVLRELLPLLEAQEDYTNDALYKTLSAYVEEKGYKNGYVMWPVRTAVSGKQMTPGGATELMEVLGKEESLIRIRKGIEKLEQL